MVQFKATFRHSDYTEDTPVVGTIDRIVSLFRSIDWPTSAPDFGSRNIFPELIVENQSNGDLLNLQGLDAGHRFQCSVILTIPNKVWGLDLWIFRETWESAAVELVADRAIEALQAFGRSDAMELKAIWSSAA